MLTYSCLLRRLTDRRPMSFALTARAHWALLLALATTQAQTTTTYAYTGGP
jgi:hypothetical protein